MQLDSLSSRTARLEHKIQPIDTSQAEAVALLPFFTDQELNQMLEVYQAVGQRHGIPNISILRVELMSDEEIAVFERIEELAKARKLTKEQSLSPAGPVR